MIYVIFFLGFLVQSVGGFGGGLLAVPLLTLIHEPKFIVPVFTLTVWILNLAVAFETRRHIVWPRVARIVLFSWISLPAGVYLLAHANQDIIRLGISLVTLILGVFFLLGIRPRIKDAAGSYMLAGLISGLLSGSAAMGGPPLIIMGYAMGWKKDEFRATLVACFALNGIISILMFYLNGLLHTGNITIVPLALLPVLLAAYAGIRIKNRLNQRMFSRLTLGLIILIGAVGALRWIL